MPSPTARKLDDLSTRFPLPFQASDLRPFSETAVVSGVPIHLAGFATDFDGECITGSAAALDEAPSFRAYMELVERLSLLVAMRRTEPITLRDASGSRVGLAPVAHVFPESTDPSCWKWARSNGVAIAQSWREAANRAHWELVERDRILRSFYGEIAPEEVSIEAARIPEALGAEYSFRAYGFDGPSTSGVRVVAVFAFPRRSGPLVFGFGARPSQIDSTAAAGSECLQRLGFLFGESIPDVPPRPSPTPDFHQEHYLFHGHHEAVWAWLRGEHEKYRGCLDAAYSGAPEEPFYADLTPPRLEGRLFVAKALARGHVPLAFGIGLPMLRPGSPSEVAVHPIA